MNTFSLIRDSARLLVLEVDSNDFTTLVGERPIVIALAGFGFGHRSLVLHARAEDHENLREVFGPTVILLSHPDMNDLIMRPLAWNLSDLDLAESGRLVAYFRRDGSAEHMLKMITRDDVQVLKSRTGD